MAKSFVHTTHYSRRAFLGASASSAFAFTFLPSRVFGANDRLQIAGIGVGGKGKSDFDHASGHGDVVAACDVDSRRLDVALRKHPKAVKFADYRDMIDKMGDKIDALNVSTPDHHHAPAAMRAMEKGIHVYVQKPLTHTVWEARQMRLLAKKNKICTQMGNQGTAENGLREGAEVVRSGGLGKIKEVHVWTNRPVWPQAPGITARPKDTPEVPGHVSWDQFIGPAPMRPYHPAYIPFKWRGWWDYGTGALGDMACHTANLAYMACELTQPTKVEAVNVGPINSETFPAWASIKMQFPAIESRGAIDFFWYEGKIDNKNKNWPPLDLLHGQKPSSSGSLIIGTKGTIYSSNDYGADWKLFADGKWQRRNEVKKPEPFLPRNGRGDGGMKEEWVRAIREGKPEIAMSNFEYSANLTESILIGNLAMRAGGKFDWDTEKLKASTKEAQQYVTKKYRKGWEVAGVS
ncbi:MAG: Gfo/Idh/MocA family oxidoreductase [Opitutales bacterium]|nr:Gfo/Idh/MocA family oxidoreductase [Opitutales bacterium]